MRFEAAESPPETSDAEAIVAALIPLLADGSELVRLAVAEQLGLYPVPATAVALREFVAREPDSLARAYGFSSLGSVGDASDLARLVDFLAAERDPHERIHLLAGMAQLSRRLAIEVMRAYLEHERVEVRTAAAAALASMIEGQEDDEEVCTALGMHLRSETNPGARADIEAILRRLREDNPPACD